MKPWNFPKKSTQLLWYFIRWCSELGRSGDRLLSLTQVWPTPENQSFHFHQASVPPKLRPLLLSPRPLTFSGFSSDPGVALTLTFNLAAEAGLSSQSRSDTTSFGSSSPELVSPFTGTLSPQASQLIGAFPRLAEASC